MVREYTYTEPALWPLVFWGDGLTGEIIEESVPYVNELGEKVVAMRVRLEDAQLARAGISYDELDEDDSFPIAYPETWIRRLSYDPANPVVYIKCSFWGQETDQTREYDEKDNMIYSLERMINSLKDQVAFLHNEINDLKNDQYAFDEKTVDRFALYQRLRKHDPEDDIMEGMMNP